jgi:hypothetical protein
MPVPSAMGFKDGCHLPLMMLGQKPAQFCAGPMTTTPEGVVFLPRGVVVRSRGTSLFFLAIALCHIDRRGFLGVLVGCWILAITRGISLLQSSSSLADWDGGSLSFSWSLGCHSSLKNWLSGWCWVVRSWGMGMWVSSFPLLVALGRLSCLQKFHCRHQELLIVFSSIDSF